MLSPVYLSSCAGDIVKLYNDLNDAIIRDVVRRLINLDFDVSQTAVWQMEKLQEVGGLVYDDALHEISKITGKTEKELKQLFEDAGTESMSFDNSVYRKAGITPLPLSQSPAMLQILTAGYRKCKGELKNLTLTTANMSQSLFINACNAAYMQVASGAFSQNTAIANAIETIGNSGTWVLYPSGHRDRADVAVRRAVQTGIGQTCGQMQLQQLDDMMWDVVDVTAHMGARPEHARWQGGRFSYKGRNKNYPDFIETTGYGSVDGLLGANCRHNFYPAIDGTPRAYSKEQIDEWNNHKVTYNGVEYSDREALDIQRAKERGIRATKRELVAFDEAIKQASDETLKKELSDDFGRISAKLSRQENSLNDFLDQTGFKKDYSRSQIKEFNRSMSGRVKAAGKKELQNNEERDIINTKLRNNNVINPMDTKRYNVMVKGLLKNGIKTIQATGDDLRYLCAIKAEASYGHGYIMHIGETPSASAMFEEVIHATQAKVYGEFDSSDAVELCAREIAANRKLLKHKNAYMFDENDTDDITRNLYKWEEKFKKEVGCSYDESSYRRGI